MLSLYYNLPGGATGPPHIHVGSAVRAQPVQGLPFCNPKLDTDTRAADYLKL